MNKRLLTWFYSFAKSCRIIHLKLKNFTEYLFHLKEVTVHQSISMCNFRPLGQRENTKRLLEGKIKTNQTEDMQKISLTEI